MDGNTLRHRQRKHRHFIAFPLFAAFVGLSFASLPSQFPHVMESVASIFGSKTDERFSFDSGVYGVVYNGGALRQREDTLELVQGSALIASKGMVSTSVDKIVVVTFDGAVHVTKGSKDITIAALTSPAFVVYGDTRMVVPVGMQWSFAGNISGMHDGFAQWMASRVPHPLPVTFVQRTLRDLSLVIRPAVPLPESRTFLPVVTLPVEDILLPVSENEVTRKRQSEALGTLRHAVEEIDAARVEELLRVPVVADALQTHRGRSVAAFLLADVPQPNTALRMLLLRALDDEESVWMLGSFHPKYRDVAWSMPDPQISVESMLARVFLLPFSMFSPEEFTDFTFERYTTTLTGMLDTVGNREAFIEHLVAIHMPLIGQLEEQEYPRRAAQLSSTLLVMVEHVTHPSETLKAAAHALANRNVVDLSPLPPKPEPKLETVPQKKEEPIRKVPDIVLSPKQVEEKTYAMLHAANALFTVNTSIASTDIPNTARVYNAIFSSPAADRTVSFTLNVVTGIVTRILIDGNTEDFPYTPSFQGFATWLQK